MGKRRVSLPISIDRLVEEYVGGASTPQLAKKYNIGATTVSRILKGRDVELRPPGTKRKIYTKDFLVEEYVNKCKTACQIGKETFHSHRVVIYWLDKYGIEQRPFNQSVSIGQTGKIRIPSDQRKHIPKGYKTRGEWLIGKHHSEETRRKMSEKAKGPLNHNWKNGAKQQPYCFKFNRALKESIRDEFDRKCVLCGTPENGRGLDVHHIDFNKMQGCGHRWNLVPLCNHCHGPMINNRWQWFNLLYCHWLIKYDLNFISIYPLTWLSYA